MKDRKTKYYVLGAKNVFMKIDIIPPAFVKKPRN